MSRPASVTQTIVGCARCHGEGHEDLLFEGLEHPITVAVETGKVLDPIHTFKATHWTLCPTVQQPILLYIGPKEGDS